MEKPEDRYMKVDDLNIRYWVIGEGTPLILVHGLAASCEYWGYNVAPLSRYCRVYTLDLPGFGRSEKRIKEYSLSYSADFLAAFLDAQGVERASVAGNSMGGAVALQFAIQHPERLERLILVDSAGLGQKIHPLFQFLLLPFSGRLLAPPSRWAMRLVQRFIVHDPQVITEEWLDIACEAVRSPGAIDSLLEVVRQGLDFRGQRREVVEPLQRRLPEIEAPTLVVWGAQDRIVPPSHAYVAQQLMENSQLRILDRCGHMPQVEKPEEFNELVLEFLRGRSRKGR